jgi:hypothetical protein
VGAGSAMVVVGSASTGFVSVTCVGVTCTFPAGAQLTSKATTNMVTITRKNDSDPLPIIAASSLFPFDTAKKKAMEYILIRCQ